MGGSLVLCWCFLAVVFISPTGGDRIVFPISLTLEEGDACTMHSGVRATCTDIRHCDLTDLDYQQNRPVRCGFNGIFPVICCHADPSSGPEPITDIAPPILPFKCGINIKATRRLSFADLEDERRIFIEVDDLFASRAFTDTRSSGQGLGIFNFDGGNVKVEAVGSVMAERNAWPWMALVGRHEAGAITWFCGGVLINEHWVLSAVHCFVDKDPEVVRLGEHNYNDDEDGAPHKDFNVTQIMGYPGYNFDQGYHDLALLKLDSRVPIQDVIRPVCLAWGAESEVDITGILTTVTGYGDTEQGGIPTSYLQAVNVTVFPSQDCDNSYSILPKYPRTWPQGIGQETLCAGHRDGGRDPCQGDSGGPMVSQKTDESFVLAGIVSQGHGCGNKEFPGLYANMRHAPYLAWIKKVAFTNT